MTTDSSNKLVYVAHSPIHGHGLFATRPLSEGQLIGVYDGPEVTEDGIYVLWVEGDTEDDWIGHEGQNDMRFMNHADAPNAEMDGLNCYALKNIAADEEITIDYGWNDS